MGFINFMVFLWVKIGIKILLILNFNVNMILYIGICRCIFFKYVYGSI